MMEIRLWMCHFHSEVGIIENVMRCSEEADDSNGDNVVDFEDKNSRTVHKKKRGVLYKEIE